MKKKILSMIFVLCLLVGTNSMAATCKTITLPTDCTWNGYVLTRNSTAYSYVKAGAFSVRPTNGGTDNFTKIRAKISSTGMKSIMDPDKHTGSYVLLNESSKSYTKLYIKDGYRDVKTLCIQFSGNNPNYGCVADVVYTGNVSEAWPNTFTPN